MDTSADAGADLESRPSNGTGGGASGGETQPLVRSNPDNSASFGSLISCEDCSAMESGDDTTAPGDDDGQFWPQTFGRSISMLAGRVTYQQVEWSMKSPRFGHLEVIRRKKLEQGFYTPDPDVHRAIREREDGHADAHLPPGRGGANQKINRMKSLDFPRPKNQSLAVAPAPLSPGTVSGLERKSMSAHEYRLEVLAKAKGNAATTAKVAAKEKKNGGPRRRRKKKKVPDASEGSSFVQCTFNMSNILMGVGLLGTPFVLKSAGWIGGSAVIVIFAAITWRTSYLIGRLLNGDHRPTAAFGVPGHPDPVRTGTPLRSFPDISRQSFGNAGAVFLALVLYFELFSCLGIFFVSIGEYMAEMLPQYSTTQHEMLFAFLLAFPTILLKTARLLSYLSVVGTVSTLAVVFAVIASAVAEGDVTPRIAIDLHDADPHAGARALYRGAGLPLSLGLFAYCFSGHAIVPSIYTSMARPRDFEKMIDYTFVVVLVGCLAVSASGYLMFGSLVEDQVTLSLARLDGGGTQGGGAIDVLTALMVLTAFSKFTLTMFPLALGMEEIFAPYIAAEMRMEVVSACIRLTLIVLALLVAIFVPSFSFLCSLVGLLCTMVVSVIFPAAAHLVAFKDHIALWEKVVDCIFIIFGLLSAIIGTYAAITVDG